MSPLTMTMHAPGCTVRTGNTMEVVVQKTQDSQTPQKTPPMEFTKGYTWNAFCLFFFFFGAKKIFIRQACMSYLKPRCQKTSPHKSCTSLSPIHKLNNEPSFGYFLRSIFPLPSTLCVNFLTHIHTYSSHLFILVPTPSFSLNNTFPPCNFLFLLSSQPPFHCAGKGQKPRTRWPPGPLSPKSSCSEGRCWALPWHGPCRGHQPITERNPELSLLQNWDPHFFDFSAFKSLWYTNFNAVCFLMRSKWSACRDGAGKEKETGWWGGRACPSLRISEMLNKTKREEVSGAWKRGHTAQRGDTYLDPEAAQQAESLFLQRAACHIQKSHTLNLLGQRQAFLLFETCSLWEIWLWLSQLPQHLPEMSPACQAVNHCCPAPWKQHVRQPRDGRQCYRAWDETTAGSAKKLQPERAWGNECFMAHQSLFGHFLEKDDATFEKTKFLHLMMEWASARTVKMHHMWDGDVLSLLHPGKWFSLGKSRVSALINDLKTPAVLTCNQGKGQSRQCCRPMQSPARECCCS